MIRSLKKHTKAISLVLAVLLLVSGFAVTKASATTATYPVTHTLPNVDTQLVLGEEQVYHSLAFRSIETGYNKFIDVKSDNMVISSSNPEIVSVEVKVPYSHSPDTYYVAYKGVNPGTAVLTLAVPDAAYPDRTVCAQVQVEVLGQEHAVITDFPGDKNMDKGGTFSFPKDYKVTWGDKSDFFWFEDCQITLSNKGVVEVKKNTGASTFASRYLKAVGPGTVTVTLTVTKEGPLQGLSKSFNVKVKQGAKATAPTLVDQINAKYSVYYNRITIAYKIKGQNATYEVWRSTSPNKNFKKVGTVKVKKSVGLDGYFDVPSLGAHTAGQKVYFDDFSSKHKVKANTKYYYKMRVKYTDEYFDNSWSKWSKVRTYWTSPKPIADKQVKYNKNTKKVTFPKQNKKMTGYIYTAAGVKFLGYNIFGGRVYYSANSTRHTTKRSFKVANVEDMRPSSVTTVIPYIKHGKYYYAHGYDLVKSPKKYKAFEGHKWSR